MTANEQAVSIWGRQLALQQAVAGIHVEEVDNKSFERRSRRCVGSETLFEKNRSVVNVRSSRWVAAPSNRLHGNGGRTEPKPDDGDASRARPARDLSATSPLSDDVAQEKSSRTSS